MAITCQLPVNYSTTMRAIILLLLLGSVIAVPQSTSRVIGGSPTTVDRYPYMASLQYGYMMWFQICGGSLINNRSVLSAAHCFFDLSVLQWRVRLGTSFVRTDGVEYSVQQLIVHPQYNQISLDNDIVVVRLATMVVYSDVIQPARIAGPNYNLPDGTLVYIAGWGSLGPGGLPPDQLHHVDVNIINQELCKERYAYLKTQPNFQNYPEVTDGMLCAGILDVGGKDACGGDSGGPVVHDGDVLVGITSWGYTCGDAFYPGVKVRVAYYTDWIVQNA